MRQAEQNVGKTSNPTISGKLERTQHGAKSQGRQATLGWKQNLTDLGQNNSAVFVTGLCLSRAENVKGFEDKLTEERRDEKKEDAKLAEFANLSRCVIPHLIFKGFRASLASAQNYHSSASRVCLVAA